MNKLLTYYSFIIVSVMVVSGFLGASSTPQLVSALLFYPMLVYFFSLVTPKKQKSIAPPQISKGEIGKPAFEEVALKVEKPKGYDMNRRAFLKLIGTAGASLFLFSVFTKKAQAAFFGSVPGPGTVAIKNSSGVQIDPAEKGPTDGYAITEIDDGTPSYYGYMDKNGNWYITKEDVVAGNYRYAKGTTGFSDNWDDRINLSYGYFNDTF